MNFKSPLLLSSIIVALITILAILNSRLYLFNIENIIGTLFSGLSMIFLPGHILAILMTNSADPPHLWGVVIGYCIQGLLIILVAKKILQNRHTKLYEQGVQR